VLIPLRITGCAKEYATYINGSQQLGLLYRADASVDIVGYSDTDWVGEVVDRKSTSGNVFFCY